MNTQKLPFFVGTLSPFALHRHHLAQFLPTKDYATFMDALGALLADKALASQKPQSAAFACAGPVVKGRCEMTNLGWTVDAAEVEKVYDIKCVQSCRGR